MTDELPDWAMPDDEEATSDIPANEEEIPIESPDEQEPEIESEAIQGEVIDPPEQSPGLMSPRDLELQSYTKEWAKSLSAQIGHGISTNETGVLKINSDVTDDTIFSALSKTIDAHRKGDRMGEILELAIGRLILEIAARTGKEEIEVISDYDLCDSIGRSEQSLLNWTRVIRVIPEECFCFQLTMTHYTLAAAYAPPEDPRSRKKFIEGRIEILKEAAKDPKTKNTSFVRNSMRALKKQLCDDNKALKEPARGIYLRLIEMFRIRDSMDAGGDIGESLGITRADLTDNIEADINELINRDLIEAQLELVVLPFQTKTPERYK